MKFINCDSLSYSYTKVKVFSKNLASRLHNLKIPLLNHILAILFLEASDWQINQKHSNKKINSNQAVKI